MAQRRRNSAWANKGAAQAAKLSAAHSDLMAALKDFRAYYHREAVAFNRGLKVAWKRVDAAQERYNREVGRAEEILVEYNGEVEDEGGAGVDVFAVDFPSMVEYPDNFEIEDTALKAEFDAPENIDKALRELRKLV